MLPFLGIEVPQIGNAQAFEHVPYFAAVLCVVMQELDDGGPERLAHAIVVYERVVEPLLVNYASSERCEFRLEPLVPFNQ